MGISQVITVSDAVPSILFDHEIADFWSEFDVTHINAGIMSEPLSTISGAVWADANEDGIRTIDEELVSSARVALYQYDFESGLWRPAADVNNRYEQTTDANGRYSFIAEPIVYDTTSELYMRANRYRVGFYLAEGMHDFTAPSVLGGQPFDSKAIPMVQLLEDEYFEGFDEDYIRHVAPNMWAFTDELDLVDYPQPISVFGITLFESGTADTNSVRDADFIYAGMLPIPTVPPARSHSPVEADGLQTDH